MFYSSHCLIKFNIVHTHRFLRLSSNNHSPKYAALQSLEVDQSFANEETGMDSVSTNVSYSNISDWHGFFMTSLTKRVIAMIASKDFSSRAPQRLVERDMLADEDKLQKDLVHATPAQKLQPTSGGMRTSCSFIPKKGGLE